MWPWLFSSFHFEEKGGKKNNSCMIIISNYSVFFFTKNEYLSQSIYIYIFFPSTLQSNKRKE